MLSEEAIVLAVLRTQDVVGRKDRLATALRSSEFATEVAALVAGRYPVLSKVAAIAERDVSGGRSEFGDLVVKLHRLVCPGGVLGLQAVDACPLAVDGGLHCLAITGIAWCLFGWWSIENEAFRNKGWCRGGDSAPHEEHSSKGNGGAEFGNEGHCEWYVLLKRRGEVG